MKKLKLNKLTIRRLSITDLIIVIGAEMASGGDPECIWSLNKCRPKISAIDTNCTTYPPQSNAWGC